jgi:hypothetical protein
MVFSLSTSQYMEREVLDMKKLIGILVMGMVVVVSHPVAAQYQSPNEQQYQQEDRDAYLNGLADGRMGNPPSQNNSAVWGSSYGDLYRTIRNNTRQDPYRQGYDDGEREQQRDYRE